VGCLVGDAVAVTVGWGVVVYLAGELTDDHVTEPPKVPSMPLPLPLLEAVVPDLAGRGGRATDPSKAYPAARSLWVSCIMYANARRCCTYPSSKCHWPTRPVVVEASWEYMPARSWACVLA
jgi:hypothetical protein